MMVNKWILIFLSALLFYNCSKNRADDVSGSTWQTPEEVLPVAVEALVVYRGQLIPEIEASGVVRGVREAWTVSETRGEILEVFVSPGDYVEKGSPILRVEDELAEINRDLAEQQYEALKGEFSAAENSYKRGGLSRLDYNSQKIRLLQAAARFRTASREFENTHINAPFPGYVALMDSSFSPGNYLTAGKQVARIVDLSSFQMEIFLGEKYIGLVDKGLPVVITALNRSYSGLISSVGSGSNPETGGFPVNISWDNPGDLKLRSGISARVKIRTNTLAEYVVIPSSALVVRNRQLSVFLEKDGLSFLQAVVAGEEFAGRVVIKKGLSEGDVLILSALTSLRDNYPVEVSFSDQEFSP